jgi:hypothetical protein
VSVASQSGPSDGYNLAETNPKKRHFALCNAARCIWLSCRLRTSRWRVDVVKVTVKPHIPHRFLNKEPLPSLFRQDGYCCRVMEISRESGKRCYQALLSINFWTQTLQDLDNQSKSVSPTRQQRRRCPCHRTHRRIIPT